MKNEMKTYLAKIGKKGGKATAAKHPDHFRNIAKKRWDEHRKKEGVDKSR